MSNNNWFKFNKFNKGEEVMMFHQHRAVKRFHEDHSRYLAIADHDRFPDGSPRIPPKVVEKYRVGLVRSLALPVLSVLIDWAWDLLKDSCANGAVDQIHDAMESVDKSKLADAVGSLEDAADTIVRNIEYSSLSLAEMSSIAWLVSELVDLSERLAAPREKDYFEGAFLSIGRNQWVRLSRGDGHLSDLVPIMADTYCEHGKLLCLPKDTTAEGLITLIEGGPKLFALIGFAVARWAATHGHLVTLNDAILGAVASWGISPNNAVHETAGKTQRASAC